MIFRALQLTSLLSLFLPSAVRPSLNGRANSARASTLSAPPSRRLWHRGDPNRMDGHVTTRDGGRRDRVGRARHRDREEEGEALKERQIPKFQLGALIKGH